MRTVAGIDMGTQSIKIMLYDWETKCIVAAHRIPMDIITGNDGTREQKIEWYQIALLGCFHAFSDEQRASIVAIGISGHQHGFVPLDEQGNALYNVKLWNDTSTTEECRFITEAAGGTPAVIKEVQNCMLPGFTAPKILWLKRHFPEAYRKLRYIMLPHNYLNFLLCGEYSAECGDASGTALFNGITRTWSKKICDIIDKNLYNLLPQIKKSWEPCGFVSPQAAALYKIPEGIPVSTGGGDNMMSAIGTGTVNHGCLTMSMGTSGTLFGYSNVPVSDPEHGLSGFNDSTGGYLPLLCTMNCTVATEQTRKLFRLAVQDFDNIAAQANPGADGIIFLPFFNGERTPNLPRGQAGICGITTTNNTRQNIARAAMEASVYSMKTGTTLFARQGFHTTEIRLTGGGGKSRLWRQITADIMQLPVKIPVQEESAAMGAALQALWCLNPGQTPCETMQRLTSDHILIDETKTTFPDSNKKNIYEDSFNKYMQYVTLLTPAWQ